MKAVFCLQLKISQTLLTCELVLFRFSPNSNHLICENFFRINVENFPKDMTSFKKDLARNPQKFKDKTVKRKT